ncbi:MULTISPECIES: terminase large subunit domain-containing protein [Yersinia]|uniref:phage terminase large subunit family protein n=1 Tax=Yersinia TaxID=629 RepID=UPI000F507BE2|nr:MULTISPECIES: terminase family protein [Yersinia]AYX15431.1 DNA packaging protein [Yersinia pseudotuberculosis]VEB12147.1 Bacteriophage terminase large (ATPase) subunit and inactivated derivatives [Yersinia pseudotuberculosis]
MEKLSSMTREQKLELIRLIEEKNRRSEVYRYRNYYSTRYAWQRKFIANTAEYSQVALIAANRVGKTDTATYIDAIHAMGDYPDGWEGYRFDHAPLIWVLGYSGEKCRDLLQTPLIGRKTDNGWEGGLIPGNLIVGVEPMAGTPNAIRSVYIKHKSGDLSKIQFWSYSQGQHALMGDSVDWFHVDEEPKDPNIYPQVLTRTATGDKGRGGRGILTFTPENGRTELVIQFMDTPSSAQVCMNVGWDDAPHLNEKVKADLLASYPSHQRDMRTKGIPMLGHGRIYEMSDDSITCPPFECPDHFFVINGQDFGWDHPQAHIQLWEDRDTETIYISHVWKARGKKADEAWRIVKPWAQNIPVAWPHDGNQHEKGGGQQLKVQYADEGFKMLPSHATWPDGDNRVEPGIQKIRDLMLDGKLKVFSTCSDFFEEFRMYHRNENGQIAKTNDDVLDAVRYAYMMRRFAKQMRDIKKPKEKKLPAPIKPIQRRGR